MAQPTDVVLDAAGYMLAPGTYSRSQDGMAEGRTGRITFSDFFGGLARHIQLERDRAYDGEGVGPALNGQGVQPWGHYVGTGSLPSGTTAPNQNYRVPVAIVNGVLHVAFNTRLLKFPEPRQAALNPTTHYTAAAWIQDMTLYSSNGVILTLGWDDDIIWVRSSDATTTPILGGERGYAIAGYGGYAVFQDARVAARPTYVRQITGTNIETRILDYDIRKFVQAGAHVYAITDGAIYEYSGRVRPVNIPNPAYTGPDDEVNPPTVESLQWSGDWTPFFQHGVNAQPDDYIFFVGFGGDILAWVADEVMVYKATGERAGWRSTGLRGKHCYGGCVAGGYAVVSIVTYDNRNELWAWDGSGWWKIDSKPFTATGGHWIWPTNANGTGNGDLIVWRHGELTFDLYRLAPRSSTLLAFPGSGYIDTPMIDAGERDKDKAWRKVGATFSSPELFGNLDSTDSVNVSLRYSVDGGATWELATSRTLSGNTLNQMTFELDAAISAPASRWLMLRVAWSSVVDWAPILTGMWAEFEVMDSPARRRKWSFAVAAHDQVIDRDGGALSRTGRELIADLWQSWEDGTTVTFRDIDFDDAPTERTVRIVGITEDAPKPSDHGRWGDSILKLQLVEV